MRLIDADKLECDTTFDVIEEDYIAVSKRQIDDAPTVEAIPVEQVAEILKGLCGFPCIYVKCKNSNFCKEYCTGDYIDTKQCWLHALKEGWLDDVRNT